MNTGPDDADIVRVLVEHVDIRRRIDDLETAALVDSAALNALGEQLRDHVRHEEQTLFVRIEAELRPAELAAVALVPPSMSRARRAGLRARERIISAYHLGAARGGLMTPGHRRLDPRKGTRLVARSCGTGDHVERRPF
jgi:hypothetical protein